MMILSFFFSYQPEMIRILEKVSDIIKKMKQIAQTNLTLLISKLMIL